MYSINTESLDDFSGAQTVCPICDYKGYSPRELYHHLSDIHGMTEGEMIDLLFAVVKAILEELNKVKRDVGQNVILSD